jgi:hypothetical protein
MKFTNWSKPDLPNFPTPGHHNNLIWDWYEGYLTVHGSGAAGYSCWPNDVADEATDEPLPERDIPEELGRRLAAALPPRSMLSMAFRRKP